MVCVPCFIIPVLLFIWHKFIQPYVLRFWNPWEKKDKDGNVIKSESPFQCIGNQCKFIPKGQQQQQKQENQTNDTRTENLITSGEKEVSAISSTTANDKKFD